MANQIDWNISSGEQPTEKQINYYISLGGNEEDTVGISKKKLSAMIQNLKSAGSQNYYEPSVKQLEFAKKLGIENVNVSRKHLAQKIKDTLSNEL